MTPAHDVLEACKSKDLKIALAESCTGGMISAALTDIAGSSAVVDRGFVTYTNTAKTEMLGVREATLAAVGAVSEEVAREMALGARVNSDADLAVSVTGIAGPGGSEFKPEGRVCFGIATRSGCETETIDFGPIGRPKVRQAALNHAVGVLLAAAQAH